MSIEDTKLEMTNIETLFGRDFFKIPVYQRDYSWDNVRVSQFWEDFCGVVNDEVPYFFGPMYLTKLEPEKSKKSFPKPTIVEVIDGQQRIATISLFFIAVRDIAIELNSDSKDKKYAALIIALDRLLRTKDDFKLTLNKSNLDYFKQFQKLPDERDVTIFNKPKGKSNKNILSTYTFFILKLKEVLKSKTELSEKNELLQRYVSILSEAFFVEAVNLIDDDDAYTIFESINYRGLDLSVEDLFKNQLFKLAKDLKVTNIETVWDKAVTPLKDESISVADFLRYFWLSTEGYIADKQLYKALKDKTKKLNKHNFISFIDTIVKEANNYNSLRNPKSYDLFTDRAKTHLINIKNLNYKVCYPLLLSGMEKYNKEDFEKLCQLCLYFLFRYVTISKKSTSQLNLLFSTYATLVRKDRKDVAHIKKLLLKENPTDDDFEKNCKNFSSENSAAPKYYLTAIEIMNYVGERPLNIDDIQLEHIIPQTLSNDWIRYLTAIGITDDEKISDIKYSIGNMTIILGKWNTQMSNKLFKDKKEIYSKSEIAITKSLSQKEKWTEADVISRAETFSKIAKQIWKIS